MSKAQPVKLRTAENADRICEMLGAGRTLRQVAQRLGCDHSAILHWVKEDQDAGGDFSHRYARAKSIGYELMVDELRELADTPCLFEGRPDNALVQQLRVQIDARKWLLSKLLPRQFGDKVTQELTGDPDRPVVSVIQLVPVAPKQRVQTDDETAIREASTLPLRVLSSRS